MVSAGAYPYDLKAVPAEYSPLVAVIEDDQVSRGALGRVLSAGGFEPALFDSVETFIASPPARTLFCVIADVHLAGMSGIDLQRKLQVEGSDLSVIIITANRARMVREQAEQAGCAAFLWKPFSAETLLSLLASIGQESHS